MTHFMAYVVLLSAGVGACALAAELILRIRIPATRWVWLSALTVSGLVAVIATVAPAPAEIEAPISPAQPLTVYGITAPPVTLTVERRESRSIVQIADSVLPPMWGVASVLLLFAILIGQRRLTIARRSAEPRSVHGHEVMLTENLGPAVAGFRRPVVFLPRWVLALDPQSQQLLLAHEFEHAKRGDTRLLLAGALAAAMMPWNPVIWWITRRLRLAVEQDCDARVLRTHPDVRRYADLLLTAASRPSVYARLLAAHFGEHSSDLDRRIQAMTDKAFQWRPVLMVGGVAAALVVASCEAPRPEPLAPRERQPTAVDGAAAGDVVYYEHQVEKPVKLEAGSFSPRYPDILRQAGVEGEALVSFVVDERGNADEKSLSVIRATHDLFATAVKEALPKMRFAAAEIGGKSVRQMVIEPFSFTLPGGEARGTHPRKLAFTVRRHAQAVPDTPPNVILYSIDGTELARGEDLLTTIEPQSIHSIEVFRSNRCPADMTCPLIKITLARGKTLGGPTMIRPDRDETTVAWERKAEPGTTHQPSGEAIKATMVEQDGRREARNAGMVQWPAWTRNEAPNIVVLSVARTELRRVLAADVHKNGVNAFDEILPADVAALEYHGRGECAPLDCPLVKVIIRPGREAAYQKR